MGMETDLRVVVWKDKGDNYCQNCLKYVGIVNCNTIAQFRAEWIFDGMFERRGDIHIDYISRIGTNTYKYIFYTRVTCSQYIFVNPFLVCSLIFILYINCQIRCYCFDQIRNVRLYYETNQHYAIGCNQRYERLQQLTKLVSLSVLMYNYLI